MPKLTFTALHRRRSSIPNQPTFDPAPRPTPRADALEAYKAALKAFACETLEKAAALDAMRREAVGHAPFELTDMLPEGRKGGRQIAEKLLSGTELYTALQQTLSECSDNLLPLLAVTRVLDSLEDKRCEEPAGSNGRENVGVRHFFL